MQLDPTIFKAYDIRGVYPTQINEQFAYKFGQVFAVFLQKEYARDNINIAVGRDMRESSNKLAEEVIKGIVSQGVDVIDIGLVSTPTFYYAVDHYNYAGGIQVSASHNPAQFNGFKMVRAKAIPISADTGIMTLKEMMQNEDYPELEKRGNIERVDDLVVIQDNVFSDLDFVNQKDLKRFKIVMDSANAMGGPMFKYLFEELESELISINFELDGTFPNHEADPIKEENNLQLQKKVVEVGADFGIALDGDADRLFFIDDLGKTVEPAIIRGILAKIFLHEKPGSKICYDIRPGKITDDMIRENGGEPIITRVGHSLIKEKAREVGAFFAGESSGHFFLKKGDAIYERPMIMVLKIMQELTKSGQKFSEYIKPLQRYFHSGEINFEVEDKQVVFERLRQKYGADLKYEIDGLSFEWSDWWFNVRASNTENKVRLNLESKSAELTKEKVQEVSGLIS